MMKLHLLWSQVLLFVLLCPLWNKNNENNKSNRIVVSASIIPYNFMIKPGQVHYDSGIIYAPGYIDLRQLNHHHVYSNANNHNDNNLQANDRHFIVGNDSISHHLSHYYDYYDMIESNNRSSLPTTTPATTTNHIMDVIIFHIPNHCSLASRHHRDCEWSNFGVGQKKNISRQQQTQRYQSLRRRDENSNNNGTSSSTASTASYYYWCCTNETMTLGYCNKTNYGRILVNETLFRGWSSSINHDSSSHLQRQQSSNHDHYYAITDETSSGLYIILFMNCQGNQNYDGDNNDIVSNENNGDTMVMNMINVSGYVIWKSYYGYLPGELYSFWFFYQMVICVYSILFLFYGSMMILYHQYTIPMETYIIISISIGLIEMTFRYYDLYTWNKTGARPSSAYGILWIGIMIGIFKKVISRCLFLMVAMGYGVTRDTLGYHKTYIILFGILYLITVGSTDLMILVFWNNNNNDIEEEQSMMTQRILFALFICCTYFQYILDLIFILWVTRSLYHTIRYLTNLQQKHKLMRMRHVLYLLISSILLQVTSIMWYHYHDDEYGTMIYKYKGWMQECYQEANYLFLLFGIAVLWKPNVYAKQYVYVYDNSNNKKKKNMNMTTTASIPVISMPLLSHTIITFHNGSTKKE